MARLFAGELPFSNNLGLIAYNGSSNVTTVPNLSSTTSATKGAVSFWYYSSVGTAQGLFTMSDLKFDIAIAATDKIYVHWHGSTGMTNTDQTDQYTVIRSAWNNVVFTWDSGEYWLYVNGVLKENVAGCTFSAFTAGTEAIGYNGTNYLTGFFKNLYVYARRLSPKEAMDCYEGNAPSPAVKSWVSSPIQVDDYKTHVARVNGVSTSALTFKFQGSISDTCPDFYSAQSVANHWDYVNTIDLESGSSISGATGVTLAADDTDNYELNASGLKWVNVIITSQTTGFLDISFTEYYE